MSDTAHTLTGRIDGDVAPARVRDYIDLLKPRVMSLVVFTGWIGVVIAPVHLHPFKTLLAVIAIAISIPLFFVLRMVQAHLREGGAALVTTHGAYAAPPVRTRLLTLERRATEGYR